MDDKPRGQAPVVPYVRFLERLAWRAKIANDLRRLTEECIEIEVIRSEPGAGKAFPAGRIVSRVGRL